jgi:hypothetical protein
VTNGEDAAAAPSRSAATAAAAAAAAAGELHAAVDDAAAAVAPLELETATDEWLRRRGAGAATTDAHCSIEAADAAVWLDGQFECCDLVCVCMVWRR